jgi:hypothetical protein
MVDKVTQTSAYVIDCRNYRIPKIFTKMGVSSVT